MRSLSTFLLCGRNSRSALKSGRARLSLDVAQFKILLDHLQVASDRFSRRFFNFSRPFCEVIRRRQDSSAELNKDFEQRDCADDRKSSLQAPGRVRASLLRTLRLRACAAHHVSFEHAESCC